MRKVATASTHLELLTISYYVRVTCLGEVHCVAGEKGNHFNTYRPYLSKNLLDSMPSYETH